MAEAAGPAAAGLDWFARAAHPLWLERGLDRRRGGFHEWLDHARMDCDADYRRLRVATRQTYVFAAAARLGLSDAREGLAHGLAFLLGPARHPEGGFANRFDLDGRVTDPTRDLYDLAFAGFALAHAHDVTGDPAPRDAARELAGFLEAGMRHPEGGFREALPDRGPRRQNPHMHLLEAALAWRELDPEGPWAGLAAELADLFRRRLYAAGAGGLAEYFDAALAPLAEGQAVEPGHHFEWVWLLHHAARLGALDPGAEAAALYAFGRDHGIAGSGLPHGELELSGAARPVPVRLWSATEWAKAEAVTPGPDRAARTARAWQAAARFLDGPPAGLWHERWDPAAAGGAGGFLPGPAPATSLYHLVLAIEVMAEAEGRHPRPFARPA